MGAAPVIRDLRDDEAAAFGRLLVEVYSALEGFPSREEQPDYYALLADAARFLDRPGVRILVAAAPDGALMGGVIYFADMAQYGSGGSATQEKNASGIRLLAVDPAVRGAGIGRALTLACVDLARAAAHAHVVLHTTAAMRQAWAMYERMGFRRAEDLDFLQQGFPVYGFRLPLGAPAAS